MGSGASLFPMVTPCHDRTVTGASRVIRHHQHSQENLEKRLCDSHEAASVAYVFWTAQVHLCLTEPQDSGLLNSLTLACQVTR